MDPRLTLSDRECDLASPKVSDSRRNAYRPDISLLNARG
jgi:hypothetical protein